VSLDVDPFGLFKNAVRRKVCDEADALLRVVGNILTNVEWHTLGNVFPNWMIEIKDCISSNGNNIPDATIPVHERILLLRQLFGNSHDIIGITNGTAKVDRRSTLTSQKTPIGSHPRGSRRSSPIAPADGILVVSSARGDEMLASR
jgi:hypothetical protein